MNPVVSSLRPEPPSKFTLLLVEDDFFTRWTAAQYLRAAEFTVVEAISVDEALTVFLSGKLIDVVFSDLNLPGDRGGDFLSAWLEKHRPHIPVLLTSGRTDGAALIGLNRLRRFVLKPYDLGEVAQLLRRMLDRGMTMP